MSIFSAVKDVLYNFTRGISSGITLADTTVKSILPNLYIQNKTIDNTTLIYSGDAPNIYPQAYGEYLDRLGYMFDVLRNSGETDDSFRQRILFSISQNSTISGIKNSIKFILQANNIEADVDIIESYKDFFDGNSTSFDAPIRSAKGTMLYGITVIITPKNLQKSTIFIPISLASANIYHYVTPDGGVSPTPIIYNDYNNAVQIYVQAADGSQLIFNKLQSIYSTSFVTAFHVPSFRYLINDIVAAGIKVNRVVIKEPGAGGTKGESYVNYT